MKIKLDEGAYMPERGDENDTWRQKHKIISNLVCYKMEMQ